MIVAGRRFRRGFAVPIRMNAYGVEIFEHARLEEELEKLPRKAGRGWADDGGFGFYFANRLAGGQGESRVLLHVGFGTPELDVRLVPDFPENMPAMEMFGGSGRPTGEGGDAFRMLRGSSIFPGHAVQWVRAGHSLFVKMMGIIENENRPQLPLV